MSANDYKNSDTFCVLPWNHLCVRPDEALKPCCRYLAVNDAVDNPVNVNLNDLQQNGISAMNNDYLKKLRQDLLDGVKRVECTKCYQQEDATKGLSDRTSLRLFHMRGFDPYIKENYTNEFDQVRYIEMSFDNICNLQCRMCDSKFSSKLQKRDKFLGEEVYKKLQPTFSKFDNIDLSGLVHIKLLGGEAFISPNFIKFLEYIESRSNPNNITMEIITNGTTIPSKKIINKLNKYNKLIINVSLDAYDKANDYQRHGSSYINVFNNAKTYEQIFTSIQIGFHSTVSVLTANKLADTLNFLIEKHKYHVSVDFVRYPRYMSLLHVPESYVTWVLEQNKHNATATKLINSFVKSGEYNEKHWNDFFDTTKKLDTFYKTNIADYNPALVKYLKEHNYGF